MDKNDLTIMNRLRYTCLISEPLVMSGELPRTRRSMCVATSQLEDSVPISREWQIRRKAETQSHGPQNRVKKENCWGSRATERSSDFLVCGT